MTLKFQIFNNIQITIAKNMLNSNCHNITTNGRNEKGFLKYMK